MIIKAQTGLAGDGFLATSMPATPGAPGDTYLCGTGVWDDYDGGYGDLVYVGADTPCAHYAWYRSLFRFDISALTGTTITSALFKIPLEAVQAPLANAELHEINDFGTLDMTDWSLATKNNLGDIVATTTSPGWRSMDITAELQACASASLPAMAFRIVSKDESTPPTSSHWYGFCSAAFGSDKEPRLEVEYTGSPVPEDTIGRAKPLALGYCPNAKPVLIDSVTRTYQVNDEAYGPVNAITPVYDDGYTVNPANYSVNLTNGTITFSVAPSGTVTCDVEGIKSGGTFIYKPGDLIKWLLETLGNISADDFISADWTRFNSEMALPMGLYITDVNTLGTYTDALVASLLTVYGPKDGDQWTIKRCLAATGDPDLELDEKEILAISVKPLDDVIWKCTVSGNRIWTVITNPDIAVSNTFAAYLANQYRQGSYEDSDILDLYPLAKEAGPHKSLLSNKDHLGTIAQLWVELYGQQRRLVTVATKLQALEVFLGDVVQITYPDYGLENGESGRVMGLRESYGDEIRIELDVLI